MCWIRIAFLAALICFLLPILQAHKHCFEHIKWRDLLWDLDNLNTNISPECEHYFDDANLCDVTAVTNVVKHNKMLLTNIIDKTAVIYSKDNPFKNSKKFVDGVVHTHSVLSSCMHSPHSTHHDAVTTCFDKLETFLNNKANSKCAWEIVHVKTREMLQRLAHFTSRRRR